MAFVGPFTPGRTLIIEVSDVSTPVTITAHEPQVALLNTGPDLVAVAFGVGTAVADETGFPVPVNQPVVLTKGVGSDVLAAVTRGAATLYVTPGSGS